MSKWRHHDIKSFEPYTRLRYGEEHLLAPGMRLRPNYPGSDGPKAMLHYRIWWARYRANESRKARLRRAERRASCSR